MIYPVNLVTHAYQTVISSQTLEDTGQPSTETICGVMAINFFIHA